MIDAERVIARLAASGDAELPSAEISALGATLDGPAAEAFHADPSAFARVLLTPLPLAAALRGAAGVRGAPVTPLAEAVADAAGRADVAAAVLAALAIEDRWARCADAIREVVAQDRVSVADAVLDAVAPRPDLAAAIAHSAGRVQVADAVMAALGRAEVGAPPPDLVPANRAWRWLTRVSGLSGLAAAAISLLWVPAWIGPDPLMMAEVAAAIEAAGPAPIPVMDAAHAGEVNVDEIATAGNAAVFVEVPSTDDAAMIIWVTEGGA